MKYALLISIVLWIIIILVLAAIAGTAYKFLYLKDYDFVVEAACDPSSENCVFRHASSRSESFFQSHPRR